MGIFKDLGFMNQSGELTSPDCNKINGLTVNNLLNNCVNTLTFVPDSDGQISILGSVLPTSITQVVTQNDWRKYQAKAVNLNGYIDDEKNKPLVKRNTTNFIDSSKGDVLSFNGTGGIDLSTHSDYDFSNDCTIELYVKFNSYAPVGDASVINIIGTKGPNGWTTGEWALNFGTQSWNASKTNRLLLWVYSGVNTPKLYSSYALSLNTWYHIALVQSGNTINLFINGVLDATAPGKLTMNNITSLTSFGRLNGYVYKLHITKFAKYDKDFVPDNIISDDKTVFHLKKIHSKLFINNKEQTVLNTTLNKPDFFGDSSNVATYLFDGNANDSSSTNTSYYSRLGWFNTDAANTNPYMVAGTKTYDFGVVTSIKTLTTSASATNPSSYNTNPFVLYTSIDNVTWVEAFRTTVSYTTEIVHTLNINTRYLKIVASGHVFSNPTKSFYIEQFGFHGTPTNITYASGRFGQGAVFNGISSISNIWNYSGTTNLTISFWIKIPALPIKPNFIINRVSGDIGGIIDLFGIMLLTTGALRFANEYNANGSQVQVDSSVIPVNTWTHIAFTLGSISAVSYVNGVRISSSSDANWGVGARLLSNFPLGISKLPYTSTYGVLFTGALDNLRFFNRALSDSEVVKLYEEDTTTFAIEYGRDRTLSVSVEGTVDKVYIDTWLS